MDLTKHFYQIAEVISSRSNATGPDAHNAWLAQAFSKVAFGHPSGMLGLDEFIAFRDGLNVKVPAKDKPQGVSLVAVSPASAYLLVLFLTTHSLWLAVSSAHKFLAWWWRCITVASPMLQPF